MSRLIRAKDLQHQIDVKGPHPLLYCPRCGAEFSANLGDYWRCDPNMVLRCSTLDDVFGGECETPLQLVTKHTVYKYSALTQRTTGA